MNAQSQTVAMGRERQHTTDYNLHYNTCMYKFCDFPTDVFI